MGKLIRLRFAQDPRGPKGLMIEPLPNKKRVSYQSTVGVRHQHGNGAAS